MNYIYIGNIKIKKTACLAPMASVADRAYRTICKEFGASYLVSEMISAKGMCYSDRKTAELCTVTKFEEPMALQIFGNEPDFMAKCVTLLEKFNPKIIDINMGCPVPKVASHGSGSALMNNPELAGEIIKEVVKVSKVPVTAKIRSGWNSDNINAAEFAKILEYNGASAITVHGRTKQQMYSGKADWDIIKKVKQSVDVPVIGNGDVTTVEDCVKMYEYTGCDLVMIGRATYGRPWIFKQIDDYFETGSYSDEPNLYTRLEIMKKHIELIIEFKGEKLAMKEARKHVAWYLKGIKNAASYRNSCSQLSTKQDLNNLIEKIKNEALNI